MWTISYIVQIQTKSIIDREWAAKRFFYQKINQNRLHWSRIRIQKFQTISKDSSKYKSSYWIVSIRGYKTCIKCLSLWLSVSGIFECSKHRKSIGSCFQAVEWQAQGKIGFSYFVFAITSLWQCFIKKQCRKKQNVL